MNNSELDVQASAMMAELDAFINLKLDNNVALVYALAQLANDRLQTIEEPPEGKGGIVSDIISSFGEFNKEHLALYQLVRSSMMEVQDSTVH